MSTQYPPTPPPPPQQPAMTPPKKKTSPWVWILGGCGVLVVLIVLALVATGLFIAKKAKDAGLDPDLMKKNPAVAVAKMMAAVHPDIEVLDVDEDRGLVKVREKKTGKTLTLNFEDLKKGKIVVKTNEGEEVAVGGKWEPPDWVPSYPGVTMNTTVSGEDASEMSGTGFFSTGDSLEKILDFYENQLKSQGMEVTREVSGGVGMKTGSLTATDSANGRTVHVNYLPAAGGNKVHVSYNAKK
jgi:hypothetical protein